MAFLSSVPCPSRELTDFAERHVRNAVRYHEFDRRGERRHFMVVPVLAVPVDEQYQPIGDCTAVVTRDISSQGIGLVHPLTLGPSLVAIRMQLAGEEVNAVIDIAWSKPLGPFELSGGLFVARLKRFPQTDRSHKTVDNASAALSPLPAERSFGKGRHIPATTSSLTS